MSPELDAKLCQKYPLIFSQRYLSMKETAMCWGFECGDGWYNIIDALCANIQHSINEKNRNNKMNNQFNNMYDAVLRGDVGEFNKYYSSITDQKYKSDLLKRIYSGETKRREVFDVVPQIEAVQVKEKFATLRFYTNYTDDVVNAYIAMAESMSARTCETCGKPGKRRGTYWVYTACDEHTKDEDKDNNYEDMGG